MKTVVIATVLSAIVLGGCEPIRGTDQDGPLEPEVGADDVDGDGVTDTEECADFVDSCAVLELCPVCVPGTSRYRCESQCQPVADNLYCDGDEARALPTPDVPVDEWNVNAVGLSIGENPEECSGGYVWSFAINYYGATARRVRFAYDGQLQYEGRVEQFSNTRRAEEPGSPPVVLPWRAAGTTVCLPLNPANAATFEKRVAAQILGNDGRSSMRVCGGISRYIPE